MENFDWRKKLLAALDKTQFMALATYGQEGVWVCPLYFAYDEKFKLYFISQPTSQHMKNLDQNDTVAAAIFSTEQEPQADVVGVQLNGKAVMVSEEEAEEAHKIYFTSTEFRKPVTSDHKPEAYIGPNAAWRMVRIIPRRIFYFDTEYFGEKRVEIPEEIYEN